MHVVGRKKSGQVINDRLDLLVKSGKRCRLIDHKSELDIAAESHWNKMNTYKKEVDVKFGESTNVCVSINFTSLGVMVYL